jgi:hypothetical protein
MIFFVIGAVLTLAGIHLFRKRGPRGALLALAGLTIFTFPYWPTREMERAPPSRTDLATPPSAITLPIEAHAGGAAAPLPGSHAPVARATPDVSSPADVDPADLLTALQGLLEDERPAGAGDAFAAVGSESGPASDVVGFWRQFTDQLRRSGLRLEYVEALRASYGTTHPRSFATVHPSEVAGELMTYLNETHGAQGVFLVTDEEAAALQQLADRWLRSADC